jgi:hypothetical protein
MVSRRLVDDIRIDSERKTLIVESFGHTDSLNSEYMVLEILQTNGLIQGQPQLLRDMSLSICKVYPTEERLC